MSDFKPGGFVGVAADSGVGSSPAAADLREKYNLPDHAGASYPPHPAAPIARRLNFDQHIRKALLDVRLAPDLSATLERVYDEHETHKA